ncbi:MAG: hypothetical protein AAFZ63_12200 [Bacteroidota bacterium]
MKNLRLFPILFCLLLLSIEVFASRAGRPIYIFAHRANDLDDIEDAIENGANAIEIDLQYCTDLVEWKVNHDFCNGSVTLDNWLDHFNKQDDRRKIAAIGFDIKADPNDVDRAIVLEMVSKVRSKLAADILINYSVGDWDNRSILDHFMRQLHANEMVAIDMSTSEAPNAQQVIDFFNEAGVVNQSYADGIMALVPAPTMAQILRNTQTATANRDGANDVKFVYSWTYEREETIAHMLLNAGCNGLLVNDCDIFCLDHSPFTDDGLENALDVIRKNPHVLRLANRSDLHLWNLVSSIEPLLTGEWIQLKNSASGNFMSGGRGTGGSGIALGGLPETASETGSFTWRMEKELFSVEQEQVEYGDVVYLRNWNYPIYLTGARGAAPAEVVHTASALISNINSKIKHYRWRVKKSKNETGSGKINLGDPIYLEVFGKNLGEVAGNMRTTNASTGSFEWLPLAPAKTPRISNALVTHSGFFLMNVAAGEDQLLGGDNRLFNGAVRNETLVSMDARPGLFLDHLIELHWVLERERGSTAREVIFYGDVIYLKNGLPEGDGPSYLTGTRGPAGDGVINIGLRNMASKEKHYQWVIKRSPEQTGDGLIRSGDPVLLASFGNNYLARTADGIKTLPYDPARRNDFLWRFEDSFIRIGSL